MVGGGGLASSANDNAEGVIIAKDANLESFPEQNLRRAERTQIQIMDHHTATYTNDSSELHEICVHRYCNLYLN